MRAVKQILSHAFDMWLRAMTIVAIALVVVYGIDVVGQVTS